MSGWSSFIEMLQKVVESGGSIDASLADNEIFKAFEKQSDDEFLNTPWYRAGDVDDYLGNLGKKWSGKGLTNAEIQANLFSAQEAEKARNFERDMSNTAHQREVVDMQQAGLNPALLYSTGAGGATTPGSPSPTSVSPGSGIASFQDLVSLMRLPAELGLIKAQTKKTEADAGKTEKETSWIDRLNEVETRLKEENVNLTKEQEENAKVYRREMEQNIKEAIERTKNEEVKRELIKAQERLAEMQANEIDQLLEVKKLYIEAQTKTEKAQAAYLGVQKAYQQKLITAGYIEAMVDKMNQETWNLHISEEEIRQTINLLKEQVKTQSNLNQIRFDRESGNMLDIMLYLFSSIMVAARGK